MVYSLTAPGVTYINETAGKSRISPLRTDVVGFVGIAERGPVNIPVPVESWRQFTACFGSFIPTAYLAYAIKAFFENGGRRCVVVRIASDDPSGGARRAALEIPSVSGITAWRVMAAHTGRWGNNITVSLKEVHTAQARSFPDKSTPEKSSVDATGLFSRGTFVRLTQKGTDTVLYRVVSGVNHHTSELIWYNEDPAARLPYDAFIHDFNPDIPLEITALAYDLLVWEKGSLIALHKGLSLIPEHERYGPGLLPEPVIDPDSGIEPDTSLFTNPIIISECRNNLSAAPEELSGTACNPVFLQGGSDGLAALRPEDFYGDENGGSRGLATLADVEEVALVCIPDIHMVHQETASRAPSSIDMPDPCLTNGQVSRALPGLSPEPERPPFFTPNEIYRVQQAMVEHCEHLGNRMAIIDPPAFIALDAFNMGVSAMEWRSRFDSAFAVFYYPWVTVSDPAGSVFSDSIRNIPPSGHVAGCYADSEIRRGLHYAPANIPLKWIQDVTVFGNETLHGMLNETDINMIRPLPGRGIRLMGARTMSSDPDWRYVNVRRLLIMIKKAINHAIQWAVFEPNNFHTRMKLELAIGGFLTTLWQQGTLAGESVAEAFVIQCNEENNTEEMRKEGRLLAVVGIAPVTPLEFIVLRVGRVDNEFFISESLQ